MFSKTYGHFILGLLTVAIFLPSQISFAGPILDRIMERRAAQQQNGIDDGAHSFRQVTLPAGARVMRDVPYGTHARQKMDIYLPQKAVGVPVILMAHGGGWSRGNKSLQTVVDNKMKHWVSKGFIFISTNYRLRPDTDPIEQANDIARALALAQGKVAAWGGDPTKFILMGHSAGAHLVALLAASPAAAYKLGARPWIGTITLDSGSLDVVQTMQRRHPQLFDQAFGSDSAYWKKASPYHELSAQATPFLLVCSTHRRDACPQAYEFVSKAASLNVRATVLEQNLSHKDVNDQLGVEGSYTEAVESFMGTLDPSIKHLRNN
jgi:arylformamidase